MSDTPKIAKISATINGGEVSAVGLRFEMTINSFPVVKCTTTEPTDEAVKPPVTAEILDRIAGYQKERLAGVTEPDIHITAEDGIGGNMTFEGFRSAPVLQSSPANTVEQFSAVGLDARVDALDLSIYRAGYFSTRWETSGSSSGGQLKPIPAADKGDVPETLAAVTDVLVENYETSLASETMPLAKQLLANRHEINEDGPLELWKKILDESDVTFDSWEKAFEKCQHIATRLTDRIKETLTTKTPGFWNKMRSLMAEFQMYYVPSFEGVGYFKRSDSKVDNVEGTIEVSASGVSLADGSQRLLQPGGVVMMGTPARTTRKETSPSSARVIAYAPDPLLPGFIQEEVAPFWLLNAKTGAPILGSEVDDTGGKGGAGDKGKKDLSLKKRRKNKEKAEKYLDEVDTVSEGVMTEMCEVMFKELQLAGSTVVLTKPLDFAMNEHIGKRVTVKVLAPPGEADGEFTAFVSGLTHDVNLRAGKALESSTQIRLTHAQY